MNRDRIVTGIILIGVGALFLLANLGMISWWSLGAIVQFWPLILVVIGINIMFKKNTIVSVISWLLFFGLIIGFSLTNFEGSRVSTVTPSYSSQSMTIKKQVETTEGDLKLNLGGIEMDMASSDDVLFDAKFSTNNMRTEERYRDGNKKVFITIEPKSKMLNINSNKEYFNTKLSKDVVWSIDADIGAVSGDMDFSDLKIKDLKLDLGAGNIDLFMGDQYADTNVEINAGASKLTLYIVKNVGVKMDITGLISKTNLTELGWSKNGDYYYSPNYDKASSKLNFDIDMGVGKLDVIVK